MNPVIVLIPGAWLTHPFYEPFFRAINLAGYSTHYAKYPSLDQSSPFNVTCEADTEALTSSIRPLVEGEGKDIVLVSTPTPECQEQLQRLVWLSCSA